MLSSSGSRGNDSLEVLHVRYPERRHWFFQGRGSGIFLRQRDHMAIRLEGNQAARALISTKVFSPLSKVEYVVHVEADFNTACPALQFARYDGASCECDPSKDYLNCGDDLEPALERTPSRASGGELACASIT